MASEQRRTAVAFGAGLVAPAAAAAALIPLRDRMDNTNIALALVVVVVAVATLGRRLAAATAALSAAAWFDFFHTKPHYSFTIRSHDDIVTAVLLLAVGLAVGELATRGRRHHTVAVDRSGDIARIHAIAELTASGEDPDYVTLAVADELRDILALRDCRFDRHLRASGDRPIARVERNGDVTIGKLRWGVDTMGLPTKQVELIVEGAGRPLGRFVLEPTPSAPIPFDKRLVAIALADQVGAALATAPV